MSDKDKNTGGKKMNRRDVIKGLATVPVLGAMAYGTWRKQRQDHIRSHKLAKELNMSTGNLEYTPYKHDGDTLRIGIIGFGIRGTQLMKAAGFATPKAVQGKTVCCFLATKRFRDGRTMRPRIPATKGIPTSWNRTI